MGYDRAGLRRTAALVIVCACLACTATGCFTGRVWEMGCYSEKVESEGDADHWLGLANPKGEVHVQVPLRRQEVGKPPGNPGYALQPLIIPAEAFGENEDPARLGLMRTYAVTEEESDAWLKRWQDRSAPCTFTVEAARREHRKKRSVLTVRMEVDGHEPRTVRITKDEWRRETWAQVTAPMLTPLAVAADAGIIALALALRAGGRP